MVPAQNIHAPRVMEATREAVGAVASVVAAWFKLASPRQRLLLAGIKLGCEVYY